MFPYFTMAYRIVRRKLAKVCVGKTITCYILISNRLLENQFSGVLVLTDLSASIKGKCYEAVRTANQGNTEEHVSHCRCSSLCTVHGQICSQRRTKVESCN